MVAWLIGIAVVGDSDRSKGLSPKTWWSQLCQSIRTAGNGPSGGAPRSMPVQSLTCALNQVANSEFSLASSPNARYSLLGARSDRPPNAGRYCSDRLGGLIHEYTLAA